MKRAVSVACAAFAVTSACAEPPFDAWRLERTRVLAARVEAAAEPSRASVQPGEAARITWLVTGREVPERLAWTFAVCLPPEGIRAAPRCTGPVLASGAGIAAGERVTMELVVPPREAAPEARELLVLSAFCAAGDAALDPHSFEGTCSAPETKPLLATTRLGLAEVNENPEIPETAVRFGDAPWPETAGCDGAPVAAPGVEVSVAFAPRPEDRAAGEMLLLSSFVDEGELDRQFTALDPGAPGDLIFPFTPPDVPGARVRLVLVLRDGRGGTSFTTRVLCVAPHR